MFAITTPIFLLILLGYGAVKGRVVSSEANVGMGRFVLYFGIPALLFRAISNLEFSDMLNPGFVGAYAVGSLLAFSVGLLLSRLGVIKQGFPAALAGMGMSCSNSGYFGYPVMLLVFAAPPAAGFAMVLLVENLLMIPLGLALLEYGASRGNGTRGVAFWKPLLKRVLSSPMILAILSGVAASLLDIHVPAVLDQSLEMLARAAAPVALFVIGGSLVGAPLRGTGLQTTSIIAGKLALHPLLVGLAVSIAPGVSEELKITAIMFAAMPMIGVYPIIGGAYGQQAPSSSILMATTVAAFFSVSVVLGLLM